MKSLRGRLTLWGGVGFAVVTVIFTFVLHLTLESQLLEQVCRRNYSTMPDVSLLGLHNSLTEAEVHQIADQMLKTALLWLIPVIAVAVVGGYLLARQSLRPIASINRQLQAKNPGNLGEPISLPELDYEFRDLLRQLNELLARLDASFVEMNNYAAKVAHELRTPLTIMRLKVEQAGNQINPELAEALEGELHRLTHVVEQSLLIARAKQGRVMAMRSVFNFSATAAEVMEDFQLLAAEQNRRIIFDSDGQFWVSADPRHVRQIVHNLLTYALKHGNGNLTVRVKRNGKCAVWLVGCRMAAAPDSESPLGLGLRVVAALLGLDPQIKLQRRHSTRYHLSRLSLPLVEQP